jgi:hypothetical protein
LGNFSLIFFMSPRIDNHTLSQLICDQAPAVNWASFSQSDWDLLLQAAQREGVGPLVYWAFSKSGKFPSLPETARNSLRAMYASTWMSSQKMLKELETLSRLFSQAEIPVVVLKGACFALTIYPDIGLRPMGDLDLLVPKEKLAETVRIAKATGYMDGQPEAYPWLGKLLHGEVPLIKTSPPFIMIELHNSLLVDKSFTYSVPVEWFWAHTEPLDVSLQKRFENLRMLTPTAQALYAGAHAILKHGTKAPLRWFYDLDRVIRFYSGRMDWELLLSQARIFEWGSALDAALSQTRAYFNTPIPDGLLKDLSEIKDRHSQWVAIRQNEAATHTLTEIQSLMVRRWYGWLILFFGIIIPSPAYMRWRYQLTTPWALPAHYLLRWWGILKDSLLTMLSFFQKNRPVDRHAAEGTPPENGS